LEWVPNPVAREIVARRLRVTGQWPGVAAWLAQLENPQWQSVVTECLTDSRPVPVEANLKGSETHSGLIKRLRDDYIQRQLAAISQQLMAPDLPEAGQRELMDRQQHLRQLKRQPLTPKSDQA